MKPINIYPDYLVKAIEALRHNFTNDSMTSFATSLNKARITAPLGAPLDLSHTIANQFASFGNFTSLASRFADAIKTGAFEPNFQIKQFPNIYNELLGAQAAALAHSTFSKAKVFTSNIAAYEFTDVNQDEEQIHYEASGDSEVEDTIESPIISVTKSIFHVGYDLLKKIAENPTSMYKLKPREFEEFIAEIFHLNNFDVQLTPQTRDGGKDIIVRKTDPLGIESEYLVECKRHSPKNKVDITIVRHFKTVTMDHNANGGIIVTTSSFTRDAVAYQQDLRHYLQLKDFKSVTKWLKDTLKV